MKRGFLSGKTGQRGDDSGANRLGAWLIVLAAAVAAAPVWMHRGSCGDDLQFHMVSWFDTLQSWKRGVVYPHWAASANFGAGEPRFVFYPPLTWMLGAALGAVLPWTWVPVAMVFVLLCGTGLGVRAFARRLLPGGAATLAGVAAVLCVYPLFTAYDRAAFGELAGGFWIPLLLLFAMKDREGRSEARSSVLLAVVVAGCWFSDAPVGVMAMYLLAAVAGAAAVMARSWLPVVRAAIGGGLGLGLAAVYVVPAAWEQRWVNVQKASGLGDPGLLIENNWMFHHGKDPALWAHDGGLRFVSWLAVWMLSVTVAGMVVVWRQGGFRGQSRRVWLVLAMIPVAVLLLQLPISLAGWNVLPKLRFLQFPWRWLLVLETPMAVFLAAAVWQTKRGLRVVAVVILSGMMVGSLVYAERTAFLRACSFDELPEHLEEALRSGAGSWGADEYEPIGTDISLVPSGLPDACFVKAADAELATSISPDVNPAWNASEGTCLATANATGRGTDHLRIFASQVDAGYAVLRLHSYPAWRVRVNGAVVKDLGRREDGLMALPVPAGAVEILVDWVTPWDVKAGRMLTAVSVFILIAMWWRRRKLMSRIAGLMGVAAMIACVGARAQEPERMQKNAHPVFEVATINPANPDSHSTGFHLDGHRVFIENERLLDLLMFAYGVQDKQIVGAPAWASERFDIHGTPDIPAAPDFTQLQEMLQSLLSERFGVKLHKEQRELAVYTLSVASGGVKMEKSKSAPDALNDETGNRNAKGQEFRFTNEPMRKFAMALQHYVDRPVVDKTGLSGNYDFILQWRNELVPAEDSELPGLFAALPAQLGLKLSPEKSMAEVLVLDTVEKPSPN